MDIYFQLTWFFPDDCSCHFPEWSCPTRPGTDPILHERALDGRGHHRPENEISGLRGLPSRALNRSSPGRDMGANRFPLAKNPRIEVDLRLQLTHKSLSVTWELRWLEMTAITPLLATPTTTISPTSSSPGRMDWPRPQYRAQKSSPAQGRSQAIGPQVFFEDIPSSATRLFKHVTHTLIHTQSPSLLRLTEISKDFGLINSSLLYYPP